MPKILTQLAPPGEDARALKEGERDRPYGAAGVLAFDVRVIEYDHLLGADRRPDRRKVDPLLGVPLGNGTRPMPSTLLPNHRGEPPHLASASMAACSTKRRCAARPAHRVRGLKLSSENMSGASEFRPEDEPKPGFAVDRGALAGQRLDVAVDRPQRDAEFVGQRLPAHRLTVAAQHLNELKQALRARHRLLRSGVQRYRLILSVSVGIGSSVPTSPRPCPAPAAACGVGAIRSPKDEELPARLRPGLAVREVRGARSRAEQAFICSSTLRGEITL